MLRGCSTPRATNWPRSRSRLLDWVSIFRAWMLTSMCRPCWKAYWAPRVGWRRGLVLQAGACAAAPRLRHRATTASAAGGPARRPPAPDDTGFGPSVGRHGYIRRADARDELRIDTRV